MKRSFAKLLRWLALLLGVVVLLAAAAGLWFYSQLRASLPQLEGEAPLPGLQAAVAVERDALGVPTIYGSSREDVARALGYLHAQDRFFQMDMMRRRAAGELSEVIGPAALDLDRNARVHGFRQVAQRALTLDTPENRRVIEAYTAGVNAGLGSLPAKPFEYIVLRSEPRAWLPEDSYLIACAMAFDLQDATGSYERSLATLRDVLGPQAAAFFAPLATPDDAALDGSTGTPAPLPPPTAIDLRRRSAAVARLLPPGEDPLPLGSNSFALSGAHTASGVPLLANDMHLGLAVPNTWYRACLLWPSAIAGAPDHRVTGVTLPGTPVVVVGSNGHVAWGFTNAYADSGDVVVVEPNTIDRSLYKRGDENVEFTAHTEIIAVRGEKPVELVVTASEWGPVIGMGAKNRPTSYRWVMHDPAALNFGLLGMETATTAAEAVDVAHHAGMPAQNLTVVDDQGAVAWTIAGRLPQRVGYDGRFPVSWTYGDRYWDGFIAPEKMPVITPEDGRLWTANNRLVGGKALALLGDGGYADAARARQIRDRLRGLERATPRDLLAIQLDDRALFLERWQQLLLRVLTPEVIAREKSRGELRALAESWGGRAAVDSAGYRLVRAFRSATADLALGSIFESCLAADAAFDWRRFHYEEPLWTLLQKKPAHLLDPAFTTWDDLLLAAADRVIEQTDTSLARATWGQRNTARIRHPLSRALPGWFGNWLNMPADPLPGDADMPRFQGRATGASERMVVSPGREQEGIFHMPGGQSGHPLSPYYRAGHEAWVKGEPTPFLPGPVRHKLTLRP